MWKVIYCKSLRKSVRKSIACHQGAVWGHGSGPAAWQFEEEQGGMVTVLTSVWVPLLCPGRTWCEGEFALHGRLGFPFLPQQFTPVQLWSFGERGQLVFALRGQKHGKKWNKISMSNMKKQKQKRLEWSALCISVCEQCSHASTQQPHSDGY